MKQLIMLVSFLALLASPLLAGEKEEVQATVRSKVDEVLNHLANNALDKKQKGDKIIATINPVFDFDRMAKLSLGKTGWVQMNEKQRTEFLSLFVKRLQESYLEKLDLYTDEKVSIDAVDQPEENRINVVTNLVSKDDKKEMIYKFYKNGPKWMVYDVEILGVSIVATYRSQFASILKTGNVEDLLQKLRTTAFAVPTA